MKPSDRQLRTIRGLQTVRRDLDARFVGRAQAVALLVLAVVAREHVLLIGPPGTAKTELITRFAGLIQARRFSYLLTRFTEPSEIFGPLDFELFQAGSYRVKTEDMLPSAEVVFLDEVFQGSGAILNTLLSLINERRFHNGSQTERTPLISVFGASSELPDDPGLQAFSDRFLLRLEVESVASAQLADLLTRGWEHERARVPPGGEPPVLLMEDLRALSDSVREVDIDPVRGILADLVGELLAQGVTLSDRRIVRAQKLVAAAALLREDGTARPRDLWPIAHLWTVQSDAPLVRDTVNERVTADGGEPLAPGRSPEHLVALAEREARRVLDRQGMVPRGTVVAAIRAVNELLTEARTHHPAVHTAHKLIREWRDRVSMLLDQHS
ncbi:AAA family ATPase [Actinocrispum wychmicini]|uniref:MoxR-like ATPase n=1 Tax=Actinocrispum wychmicini TaxID=1213861 RepID=A0A4R2JF74_9PSEU|nr:AAA family ATPase [Actinocrispum wychmicini]TCO52885.1 MoxR-like ATPase [Actinocrispum wychmicini]